MDGVRLAFKHRVVAACVDLSVPSGTRVGVHGPNGSGKSTLLRCIAGTLLPAAGTVLVNGRPPSEAEARAQLGSVLSSERSFALRLSGLDNLRFVARLRCDGRAAGERAVRDVLEELELADIAARRADRCSTGMLQQLAFARALLGQPAALLLDEPTRSMDADARARLWAALERRPELAVVLVSHEADDLERCDARFAMGAS